MNINRRRRDDDARGVHVHVAIGAAKREKFIIFRARVVVIDVTRARDATARIDRAPHRAPHDATHRAPSYDAVARVVAAVGAPSDDDENTSSRQRVRLKRRRRRRRRGAIDAPRAIERVIVAFVRARVRRARLRARAAHVAHRRVTSQRNGNFIQVTFVRTVRRAVAKSSHRAETATNTRFSLCRTASRASTGARRVTS